DMHHNLMHATNQLTNRTTLNNLSSQDSGAYTCRWFMEGDEGYIQRGEITKTITVSSTKEQIKMLNRSDSYIEIKEGEGLHIFAIFRTFPEDRTQYSSKWFKLSVDALKGINDTTNVINDGQNTVHTSFEGKDVIETVSITNTSVATSGLLYLARLRVFVQMTPHIMFSSQSSNVLFDQSSYKIGAEIRLVCYVESFPKAEVQLKTRIMGQNVWEGVGGAIAIEGTYAKGYVLNFTASENVEFKCEGRRKEEPPVSKIMAVIIHDFPPDANVSWVKPDSATSETEIKNVIYEGDKIELDCNVPKANNSTMEWSFQGKRTTYSERTTITNNTRHLIATIDAAVSDQSGTYVCTVINEKNVSQTETYSRSFEVVKIVKPRCRDCGPIEMTVKFGNAIDLTCSMDGIPEPRYKWLKDGYEVEDQSQVSLNGQTLHFPRVGIPDEGTYTCQAYNRAGTTPLVYKLKVKGAPKTLSAMSIFFIVLAFLVLLGCLVAAFILYTRQRKKSKEQARSLQVLYEQLMRGSDSDAPPLPMHGKVTMDMRVRRTAYDPKYEIDMKNLVLLGALGSGQFGSVRKGRLVRGAPVSDTVAYRGPALTVAIKSPRNGSNPEDQKALIDELKILIAIDNLEETKHPNVLSLVGAVTRNMKDGQLFVVFEMCENGDLKTFLQRYKTELKDKFLNELKEKKAQESSADDYLVPNNQTTVQYMCIHRDLAARNCLLNANKVVKIADFGMAKNEDKGYYRMNKTNVMVPYRWMAPESMKEHTFTVESDIWSYGIVIYEIFTLGSQPYPGVPNNNLHEHLKSGQRNPRPEFCHPDIYNLMLQTWDKDSERRPTFGHCYNFMRHQLELLNPEMLESSDKQIDRNAAQIAQFDQFRGPRSTAVLDEEELAAIFTDQRSPISNGRNNEDEIGERIYIKELRR
ncbi:hypothetical protein PRIPAC_96555, partial [Pristionchus pacificus]|uniref:receptor protein-tyrosine kinase n=1 Tax=Pristionchus pacificus TaxID=54126 RepID=A0A2A6B1V3_PRIPA